jgi:putative methionine-R-sulfoxide reductase with GAF domain
MEDLPVSKFDLRDVSERLARSRDTEAVVFEFLGHLQSMRSDWRAALAFYEVSQDSLVSSYRRQGARLLRRNLELPLDQLPTRLVRKFFHPSAFFNQADRKSILTQLLRTSPAYEPDPIESPLLRPIVPISTWNSCLCLALADQEDVLALLILASEKKNAFGSRAVGEIIPVKSIAAMALSQHLHRTQRETQPGDERHARNAAAEFQDRIRRLTVQSEQLEEDNRRKAEKVSALHRELENIGKNSTEYRHELERVKTSLAALEEQTMVATEHLNAAYTQLSDAQLRLASHERTLGFMREVFQVLAEEHDPESFPSMLVQWFCQHFDLERCSLMLLDGSEETLRIAAQQGMDPSVVPGVRVRLGQGVAGWVAHHGKPLLVRGRESNGAPHTGVDVYNSDSFISVPLIHNHRVFGVLNLSNKRDGEAFEALDLERAQMAGSLLAMAIGSRQRDAGASTGDAMRLFEAVDEARRAA